MPRKTFETMPTRIVPLNPEEPRDDRVREAASALEAGAILSLPTETFYGLAADALNPEAVQRVNTIKGKAKDSPVLLLLADAEQVAQVAGDLPDAFETLVGMFWPGPLSLVVPLREGIPAEFAGGLRSVAVRVPGLALPRKLAALLGRPITGVSANRTGLPACRTAFEVSQVFPEGIEMILDGGPSTGGAPSTILDLTTRPPRLLREGAIPIGALRPFVAEIRRG